MITKRDKIPTEILDFLDEKLLAHAARHAIHVINGEPEDCIKTYDLAVPAVVVSIRFNEKTKEIICE